MERRWVIYYSGNSFHDILLEMCLEQREQQESQQERGNVFMVGMHCACPKRHRERSCSALHAYLTTAPSYREHLRLPLDFGLHPWMTKGFTGNNRVLRVCVCLYNIPAFLHDQWRAICMSDLDFSCSGEGEVLPSGRGLQCARES